MTLHTNMPDTNNFQCNGHNGKLNLKNNVIDLKHKNFAQNSYQCWSSRKSFLWKLVHQPPNKWTGLTNQITSTPSTFLFKRSFQLANYIVSITVHSIDISITWSLSLKIWYKHKLLTKGITSKTMQINHCVKSLS